MFKNYWETSESFDLNNDPIEKLTKTYSIKVGYNEHRYTYERYSLLTFLTNLDDICTLLNRLDDVITTYRNPETDGNIIHDIVLNPNQEVYFFVVANLDDDVLIELCNATDKYGNKPIETCYHVEIMKHLLGMTKITVSNFINIVKMSRLNAEYFHEILKTLDVIQ